MKKYVFIDQALEKAFRSIAEELEIEDFDKQIKENFEQKTPYVSIYQDDEEKPAFTISADLFECVEVYDPANWNVSFIEPPRCFEFRYSAFYLAKVGKYTYMKVRYDFLRKTWLDLDDNPREIQLYRAVNEDFWTE